MRVLRNTINTHISITRGSTFSRRVLFLMMRLRNNMPANSKITVIE